MNTHAPNSASTAIWEALRQIMDPELDCNIVDLGLIYDVAQDGANVRVTMTLTTPGCPMQASLAEGVSQALLNLPGVQDVSVELVWDPPWHPGLMSDTARARVGLR